MDKTCCQVAVEKALDAQDAVREAFGMETPAARRAVKYREDTPFHADSGKAPVEQLPAVSLEGVARVFGYGAVKYGPYNWLEYQDEWQWGQLVGSTLRHLFAFMRREDVDQESGLPHLAHAAANILMLMQLIDRGAGKDDRAPGR